MAISKVTIQHVQDDEHLTASVLSRPDQDLEANIDAIITELDTNKADLNGDPTIQFKVKDPTQNLHALNKRSADIRYFSESGVTDHINATDNPHSVTKSQIGLGNVSNNQQATEAEFDSHVNTQDTSIHQVGTIVYTDIGTADDQVARNRFLGVNQEKRLMAYCGLGELFFVAYDGANYFFQHKARQYGAENNAYIPKTFASEPFMIGVEPDTMHLLYKDGGSVYRINLHSTSFATIQETSYALSTDDGTVVDGVIDNADSYAFMGFANGAIQRINYTDGTAQQRNSINTANKTILAYDGINGYLYAANGSMLYQFSPSDITTANWSTDITKVVTSLVTTGDGSVYVGTEEATIHRLDDTGSITKNYSASSLPAEYYVRHIDSSEDHIYAAIDFDNNDTGNNARLRVLNWDLTEVNDILPYQGYNINSMLVQPDGSAAIYVEYTDDATDTFIHRLPLSRILAASADSEELFQVNEASPNGRLSSSFGRYNEGFWS